MSAQIKSLSSQVSNKITECLSVKDLASLRQANKASRQLTPAFLKCYLEDSEFTKSCSNKLKLDSPTFSKLLTAAWRRELPNDPREKLKKVNSVAIENNLIVTRDEANKIVHSLYVSPQKLATLQWLFANPGRELLEKAAALRTLIREAMPIRAYLIMQFEHIARRTRMVDITEDIHPYLENKFLQYNGQIYSIRHAFGLPDGRIELQLENDPVTDELDQSAVIPFDDIGIYLVEQQTNGDLGEYLRKQALKGLEYQTLYT